MIEIKNCTCTYQAAPEHPALKNFSLYVKEGEFLLLTGPSGCGKTTVLRLLNGLIPYFYEADLEGEIFVNGQPLAGTKIKEVDPPGAGAKIEEAGLPADGTNTNEDGQPADGTNANEDGQPADGTNANEDGQPAGCMTIYDLSKKTGTVFQNPRAQFYTCDVRSELAFGCENQGIPKTEILARVHQTAEKFALEDLLDRSMFELSGGQKQQVACASIDMENTSIILLDEPSANLDYGAMHRLKSLMEIWKKEGKTIIVSEHRIAYLWDLCDRVVIMDDGRVKKNFTREELLPLSEEDVRGLGVRSFVDASPFDCRLTETLKTDKIMEFSGFRFSYKKGEKEFSADCIPIARGEITALIGPNGAGKTTFLNCLCGLRKCSGILKSDGSRYNAKERKNRSFLIMQDVSHQLFAESVLDEVLIGMPEEKKEKAIGILKSLDLEQYKDRHPQSLSGGQMQRLAIACALSSEKDIILLDEPTSGLDYKHMIELGGILKELREQGKTIIVATHDSEFMENCCTRKLVIGGLLMKEKQKEESPLAWLLGQTGEHGGQYILSVLLAIIGVAFSVAPYFVVINVVKGLLNGQRELSFYLIQCAIMAALWLGRVLFHAFSTAASHRATFAVLAELRKRCTEKLARMPLGAVLEQSSGALKNTLIERIDSIETTLAHIVPEFTANLLVPVFILVYIFIIDWRMGLACLATIPIGMLCFGMMSFGSGKYYEHTLTATKALNDTTVEYIGGIQVIKVFGKTKSGSARFAHDAYEAAHSYIDWMRACIIPMTFAMVIMPATLVSVLPIGGLLVRSGSLDSQDFITVIILAVGVITPLVTMMSYSDDLRTMGTVIGEVKAILEAPELERPAEGSISAKGSISAEDGLSANGSAPANKDIVLKDVHFAYKDKEVLHGVSLEIPEGSFIALVGPSGSGKSTIARLIASLWDVTGGSITLGGTDIRQIPQELYADQIAFVSQDNYLFNMSVRENIRLGNPSASDAEVEEAAKQSGCHDFIMSLENGYDTMVGSLGGHLSGGERQRISIARAMLKNAPIVILDEATAYADPENEAVIQRSVSKLTEGKTLIVIAHRLSTIAGADRIYVVKDGSIDDSGSHEELLSHHGLYETMWKAHMEVKDNG